MYNASEPNRVYQIKQRKARLKQLGYGYHFVTAATTNDDEQAAESLAKERYALYLPADNVMARRNATTCKVRKAHHFPAFPAASTMVKLGGTITKGTYYRDLGKQTRNLAIKHVKGTAVKKLSVEKPAKVETVKNETNVKNIKQTDDHAK